MSTQTLYRWGALSVILTALLFAAAAIAVIVVPDGGLSNPVAPILYYAGLILAVPAYLTLYSAQSQYAGKLGFTGFVMAVVGSIMYSGPAFVLIAGTSGVATWHDVWGFAMGNVLPLGATIFLIGSILFGIATRRANVFSRNAGLLLIMGASVWLIAFFTALPFSLSIANVLTASALSWMGTSLYSRNQPNTVQIRQTA